MGEFVGPIAEVVKCIAEPIKRQFNYLCCFNTNIQNLRDEAKRLDDAKEGLQRQVEAAERNTENIVPEVETWLGNVDKIQDDYSSGIEPAILNVKSGCLAIKSRFSLSRKATKMAAAMKELHSDGRFGKISTPAPPAAMSSIPLGQVYELKSRKYIEEDIMASLRERVSLMGLYGMGGVGKTTMAKKIMTRAREEGLFDEIVIAVVSQPVDMLRIQKEMAELLGLNLGVDGLLARAHLLRTRLKNTKSILIILDDLWKGLNLEELGIPKECTILLTSRDRDVFSAMNVEKTFQVKTLEDVEAWSLFKEINGACDDQSLFPIAQEVVRECKGLPIAIVTVGVALKDKMDKFNWEDALHELRSCNPQDIPNFLAQVYNPLKLSYDLLESPCAKSIFLLCCLFPEDCEILISDLCLYAWGLNMIEGRRSLQVARNKVQTLIKMLISRSLLLDGKYGRYVKMHDVVRDVGIFIAAEEGLIDPNLYWKSWETEESNYTIDCSWISLFGAEKIALPGGSTLPNLRFLLIEKPWHNQERHPLCDNLFKSAENLYVLSIRVNNRLKSLPNAIQLQKNIRTLILYDCFCLADISVVGELVSLEILRCELCQITEVPVEIGKLNKLKLLDISYCQNLSRIPAGVISKLISLEELTLFQSFKKWELVVEEGKNAAVCELNLLSNLTKLKIHIYNACLDAQQIHLPNLVEFHIIFGNYWTMDSSYGKKMELVLERDVIIGDWIHQLLRNTESLLINGEGSSKLLPLLPQFQSLMELQIENVKFERTTTTMFPLLESLRPKFNDDNEVERTKAAFGMLEDLTIDGYDNISNDKSLNLWCDQIPFGSFTGLDFLEISNCGNTKSLFSTLVARNIVNLRVLSIDSCGEMVKIIEGDEDKSSIFIKLEELYLEDLPKLEVFCDWRCALLLPSLKEVDISECPGMERFSFGSLTTPNLENIIINNEDISNYTKDLNDALRGDFF